MKQTQSTEILSLPPSHFDSLQISLVVGKPALLANWPGRAVTKETTTCLGELNAVKEMLTLRTSSSNGSVNQGTLHLNTNFRHTVTSNTLRKRGRGQFFSMETCSSEMSFTRSETPTSDSCCRITQSDIAPDQGWSS